MNSFESGDQRIKIWIDTVRVDSNLYYYSYKYRSAKLDDPVIEYQIVFRLSEQFLIRAEARAQLDNLEAARSDLNIIRRKAGLTDVDTELKSELLTAILKERRAELFTEWEASLA